MRFFFLLVFRRDPLHSSWKPCITATPLDQVRRNHRLPYYYYCYYCIYTRTEGGEVGRVRGRKGSWNGGRPRVESGRQGQDFIIPMKHAWAGILYQVTSSVRPCRRRCNEIGEELLWNKEIDRHLLRGWCGRRRSWTRNPSWSNTHLFKQRGILIRNQLMWLFFVCVEAVYRKI